MLSDAGSSYAFAKNWNDALFYFEKAEKEEPNDTIVLGNLGQVYLRLGQTENARRVVTKIIALDNDPEAVGEARKIIESLDRPAN